MVNDGVGHVDDGVGNDSVTVFLLRVAERVGVGGSSDADIVVVMEWLEEAVTSSVSDAEVDTVSVGDLLTVTSSVLDADPAEYVWVWSSVTLSVIVCVGVADIESDSVAVVDAETVSVGAIGKLAVGLSVSDIVNVLRVIVWSSVGLNEVLSEKLSVSD